ncbi:hypothetical protein [Nonomuraea sp. NPDC046570]|uniref:hypothetical protein n=1 Tax=Nonomuraea sp. NPDC046570 TaxID=3155255 RepID=UPI00340EBA81
MRLAMVVLLLSGALLTQAGPAEAAGHTIAVTSPSLIFEPGRESIRIASSAASVSWRIADEQDTTLRTGTSWMSSGQATVNATGLGPGYFGLSLHAGSAANPTDLRTSYAVIEPVPAASRDAPFGAAVHIGRPGWPLGVLDEARRIGISHIREDAYWHRFETTPGAYTYPPAFTAEMDRARALDITPLVIANGVNPLYDNGRTPSSPAGVAAFGNFAAALLGRYGERDVEVLNEYNATTFNTSVCGTTAACYLDVLRGVSPAVRAAVPGADIVGPATIGVANCVRADGTKCFAPDLIDRGGLAHLDAYSVHPYHYPGGPEWLGGPGDTVAGLRQRIRAANNGQDKPIYLSEMGWPTDTGHGTTERQQADNLIRLYAVALADGVHRVYWYDLVNDGSDPADKEHNFGLRACRCSTWKTSPRK